MIQERAISSLYQRLGWRKPTISAYDILDANNLKSDSGKYFDDFSAFVTVKNVKDTQENPGITDPQFNEYLKSLQEKAIMFVLESVFNTKIYENKTLLDSENGNSEVITLQKDTFYGIEIDLIKGRDISMLIKQVGLYFDTTSSSAFKLYLYHSNQYDPVKTFDVTTKEMTEVFTDIDETIYAFSKNIKGGKYYLGFHSADVTGSPINRQELAKQSCFVGMSYFRVPVASTQMFDTNDIIYTSEEYLNLDYSAERDFTEFIISNYTSFDFAIGLQHAVNVLEVISNTTRSNNTERNLTELRLEAFLELNGNDSNPNIPFRVGLASKLSEELRRLKGQFNSRCRAYYGTLI